MKKNNMLAYLDYLAKNNLSQSFLAYRNNISAFQYQIPIELSCPYIENSSNALDWSCGDGNFSKFLISKGINCTAFSFGKQPDVLTNQSNFTFVQGTPEEPISLPFPDESFDLVFSIGVLEHVHETGGDQQASLHELSRIIRKKGFFLCFHLPYKGGWVEFIGQNLQKTLLRKCKRHYHSRRFFRHEIDSLIKNTDLKIQSSGRYNFLPRNITSVLPNFLKNNHTFFNFYNTTDLILQKILPFLCTNSYFIAQKQ